MRYAITHVTLIDGNLDKPLINQRVLFDQDGIIAIGPDIDIASADRTIEGEGMTLLPGLIDTHVHLGMDCSPDVFASMTGVGEAALALSMCKQGEAFLAAGITTVRSLGTPYNADLTYREAVKRGVVRGPRVYGSGCPLVMTGGHGYPMGIEVDGEDAVRAAARTQLKAGADLVKVMATGGVLTRGTEPGSAQFTPEELTAACQEAAKAGKPSAAHAIGLTGIKNALYAGISSIEHGYLVDDEAIALMVDQGTYLIPTLFAPSIPLALGTEAGIPEFVVREVGALIPTQRANFRKAVAAGVKIVAGTDAGTPFNYPGLLVEELKLMVQEGMTPMQAIKAATTQAAQCLGISQETGTVREGNWADLVLVQGNPLQELEALKNVNRVFLAGEPVVGKP